MSATRAGPTALKPISPRVHTMTVTMNNGTDDANIVSANPMPITIAEAARVGTAGSRSITRRTSTWARITTAGFTA